MPIKRMTVLNIWVQGLLLLCVGGLNAQSRADRITPKNIINIVLDDADYSDFGFNNFQLSQPDAITPNIDRLRRGGRLFPNYYAGCAYCSPTRVSVLTGCNPIRFGALQSWPAIENVEQGSLGNAGLPWNVPQLGIVMQGLGKKTGHFGKWHVGSARAIYRPSSLGFDEHGGFYPPAPAGTWSGSFNLHSSAWGSYAKDVDYLDDEMTNMVGDFILRNAQEPQGFFVNFWPLTPHFPWAEPRNFDNRRTQFDLSTDRGRLLAMMYSIDHQIGRIVALVDSLGIREQTLIVVSSDNGGQQTVRNISPYLYGTKGNLFEGGVKVSMIANWSGSIVANSTNYSVVSSYDLLPTLVDLCAGAEPSALYPYMDGRSKKLAFFTDQRMHHDPIYSELQGSSVRTSDERAQRVYSLLIDNYRLTKAENRNPIAANDYVLNDLQADPAGRVNISRANPVIVEELKKILLQARVTTSRLPFPDSTTRQSLDIPFDPRFDICRREATFVVDVNASVTLSRAANIIARSGSFRIELLPSKSVRWTITGTNFNGAPLQQKLSTAPLTAGVHRLVFAAQGFKDADSFMHNQIYVDGKTAADTDSFGIHDQIFSFWSTESGVTLGDPRLVLKNVRFHSLRLWPDEIQ